MSLNQKIYINGRFLSQRPTGVERFANDFLLSIKDQVEFQILVPSGVNVPTEFHKSVRLLKGGHGYFWEQITLAKFLKINPGILINLCNVAPLLHKNNIVTIHDLAFENKKWVNWKFNLVYRFLIPRIAKRAKHIFTVSKTIKEEIKLKYAINESRISVIYNRISEEFLKANLKKVDGISAPFILTVGSLNPRKNYKWLSEVFAKNNLPTLIIVGGSSEVFKQAEINTSNCEILGYSSVEELKWMYENAQCFINFSFYEGFGIPTIEAMSMGTPIICSEIAVNKEIAGEEVMFVALGDEKALVDNLIKLSGEKWNYTNHLKFQNFDNAKRLKDVICGLL